MLKRFLLATAVGALLLAGGVAHARDASLVGVVTRVEPSRLELSVRGETASVALGPETTYVKWLLAKPWEQDIRTDLRSVRVGRRVHVELAPDASSRTARTVWIVTGRPGLD